MRAGSSRAGRITWNKLSGNQCLDDFGIQPFDAKNRAALMEIIEDRHGKNSLIITSQLPVSKWHEVIGEKTIADAILDRIVHDAHRLELTGESMRKKRKPEAEM